MSERDKLVTAGTIAGMDEEVAGMYADAVLDRLKVLEQRAALAGAMAAFNLIAIMAGWPRK